MKKDSNYLNRLPALFVPHGAPTFALDPGEAGAALADFAREIVRPKAVLVISAHWDTDLPTFSAACRPQTIHDFYGFPDSLFQVQYPAPGSPSLAERVQQLLGPDRVQLDDSNWGLDHGTWSVLRHIYPRADVPVVQLSLDMSQSADYHYKLGKELEPLRREDVLILGSGNLVHNLRRLNWADPAPPHPWAVEADQWFKTQIMNRDDAALVKEYEDFEAGRLSVPTPDHYYPFLYVLGASDSEDRVYFDIEQIQHASISMRSVRYV